MAARYNADLANDLGNLASRVLAMLASYFEGLVPQPPAGAGPEQDLAKVAAEVAARYDERALATDLSGALAAAWEFVGAVNRYLVEIAPWSLAKDADRLDDLRRCLYASAESLRILAILITPVMPRAARILWDDLGVAGHLTDQRVPAALAWGGLQPGSRTRRGEALFPRLET
jgi:methionyl-tRNA synthetase